MLLKVIFEPIRFLKCKIDFKLYKNENIFDEKSILNVRESYLINAPFGGSTILFLFFSMATTWFDYIETASVSGCCIPNTFHIEQRKVNIEFIYSFVVMSPASPKKTKMKPSNQLRWLRIYSFYYNKKKWKIITNSKHFSLSL